MKKLDGKIALITGGNSGIGFAIARRFIQEGARVIITARRKVKLDQAVAELGEKATGFQADISKLDELDNLYQMIKEKFGHLDIVAANAGGGELQALGEITEESYYSTYDTNVKGVIFTVQKALPLLSSSASIILTGSTASAGGTPSFSVYSSSKSAVRNLARSWILDLKGKGIRINVLSPGSTETPGLVGLVPEEHKASFVSSFASQVPLGRVAEPDEIASVAAFLASDDASYVNGAELFVDGGLAQI
ncbi:SDR family NAD(P)-dependent oxidoreductase [Marinomonas aquiplantarum]|uniref:NAD(P)-dependent dehydrogenase (Short-subunit alcohol dehydrogenase family) n=1 Tax=Marinomonas aquiplantarum TaxID=491951 RepID=A0A366CVM4_9GAMM|nr:SDR family oxidoreductase [Marinomonas aquiplantarum]RBO81873.1 NAD(P)-dependent dehydrogenase (short-subunit alcohol dehydrogenase family) [Marinomonas aquiplantarum]